MLNQKRIELGLMNGNTREHQKGSRKRNSAPTVPVSSPTTVLNGLDVA